LRKVSDKLGSVIKTARTEMNLTQKQLAERLSITPNYLMSLENKGKTPSADLLFRIIRELEISADTIFYPENGHDTALVNKLQILLSKCDDRDITVIIGTIQSLIQTKNPAVGE